MYLPCLLLSILLVQLLNLHLASPSPLATSSPIIHPRGLFCSNAPSTKAGSPLARSPSQPTIWCSPGSSTWLQLTFTSTIPGLAILEIVDQAYAFIMLHISQLGDGVILGGMFNWYGRQGRALSVINAANHQCTWGVLGAAVRALGEFMREGDAGVGGCYFVISDGMREVAMGTLG